MLLIEIFNEINEVKNMFIDFKIIIKVSEMVLIMFVILLWNGRVKVWWIRNKIFSKFIMMIWGNGLLMNDFSVVRISWWLIMIFF